MKASKNNEATLSGKAARTKKMIKNKETEEELEKYMQEELREFEEAFKDVPFKND